MNKQLKELTNSLFGEMRDMIPEESKAMSDYISKTSKSTGINIWDLLEISSACQNCSNHHMNGGNGICHCTLGMPKITC